MRRFLSVLAGLAKVIAFKCFSFIYLLFMPTSGKRLIYLTTVFSQLTHEEAVSEETTRKLNRVLKLAPNEEALLYPLTFGGRLWMPEQAAVAVKEITAEAEGQSCLPYSEARQAAEAIMKAMPRCMYYANEAQMIRETSQLFMCRPDSALSV